MRTFSPLPLHAAVAIASLSLLAACSGSTDGTTLEGILPDPGSDAGSIGTDAAPGQTSPTSLGSGAGGSTVDTSGYNVPTKLGCSTRAQDILILDFRSGWWAGGGGGHYSSVALPAVVGACADTSVDYHHFETSMHAKCVYATSTGGSCKLLQPAVTVSDILGSFELPSVNDYTQIWVLSGSDQDPSDIPVGDALFQGVLGETTGACIPMLIASGDGFVTHADTVAQDLGMGSVFTEETTPPSFFSVSIMPANAVSTISGSQMKPHLLFTGVTTLVDKVSSFMGAAHGDSLAASVPAPTVYNVIAEDGAGNPTIAVGASKLAGDGYRPFIFDSGWQRMYTIAKNPDTAQYLKNIVMYLSLVGCKAAPIAQPK